MESSETPREMAHLTTLPNEILHNIFRWLSPRDLASLPLVCRALHDFVKGNQKLCHDIYLHTLDAPPEDVILDWESELHDLVRLEDICHREDMQDKEHELSFVYSVVDRLLKHASSAGYALECSNTQHASRNADFLKNIFEEESNRTAFLQKSSLFDRVSKSHSQPMSLHHTREEQQQSAKLHCLYGKPILNVGRLRSTRTYPYACSKVYDLRQYTTLSRWGPFMDDETDRVDWEKVEAILIVLGHNIWTKRLLRLFSEIWDNPFSGSWSRSYIPSPKPDISSLDAKDPYGVTGTWYRVVCFLDYNDFFTYNFPLPHRPDSTQSNTPRSPLDVGEATRLIIMRIHVTSIEAAGPDYSQDLPVVHFKGVSRPLDDAWDDNASSDLRGTVGLTKEGEVRWTTYSIYNGRERWKSEGIQIGGVQSARGVVGHWFDRDYDPQGPCGPSAFWKASDDEDDHSPHAPIHAVIPTDFLLWGTLIEMEDSDPEGDMEYAGEDDEDEDEDESEPDPVSGELLGLLLDAEVEVVEVTEHPAEQSS